MLKDQWFYNDLTCHFEWQRGPNKLIFSKLNSNNPNESGFNFRCGFRKNNCKTRYWTVSCKSRKSGYNERVATKSPMNVEEEGIFAHSFNYVDFNKNEFLIKFINKWHFYWRENIFSLGSVQWPNFDKPYQNQQTNKTATLSKNYILIILRNIFYLCKEYFLSFGKIVYISLISEL